VGGGYDIYARHWRAAISTQWPPRMAHPSGR
jgi:hypothetical protein